MRELRSEVVGERRVRLLADTDGRYTCFHRLPVIAS
jgi:hypothetical protein